MSIDGDQDRKTEIIAFWSTTRGLITAGVIVLAIVGGAAWSAITSVV